MANTSELKTRARLAKQRLKMGYWESLKERRSVPDSQTVGGVRVKLRRELDGKASVSDEAMYQKVCAILDRDEATINPIGQLIDENIYGELEPAAKQRYILELSNKFRELKERYYRERTGS